MPLTPFHPAVAAWFARQFTAPTPAQRRAWPAIRGGRNALIAAPTGSGKTLAAFLAALDELVREGLAGGLPDETRVLYVSPLKALSNDVQKNLRIPLCGIRDELLMRGLPDVDIRAFVRTGDTPSSERERMRRKPPHIVVTTPESLYVLLTSDSGRRMLRTVRTVIVDEVHALAGNKRGAHLMLSLERLAALCIEAQSRAPARVGLSATQKPIEDMARFLTGADAACEIIDTGHTRARDIAIEVPRSPLEAVMANEVWGEIYDRLAELASAHRTTLIFVNTRRLAERAARFLAERLGEEHVTSHHGSLSREHRLDAENRLKNGRLRALVATASLELGIDIGDVDLVCQLGSPRAIAVFLQRVGRSGHGVNGLPKGRLFPLSRDDLVECAALLDAVRQGELDRIRIPYQPLDVLAQQIVAETASREWDAEALYECFRRAWPYRALTRRDFDAVVRMLAEGYTTRRGRRGAHVHWDRVHGRLRARRGARLVAITNGGAIPDQFDYDVILAPEGLFVGTLNEDFAFESMPGEIFQLGNTSYRILKIESGRVHVEDARGQPPTIPFWLGEAPGRSDEMSRAVSRLRGAVSRELDAGVEAACAWLEEELHLAAIAAQQLTDYLGAAKAALGVIPTQDTIVFERFFDETGDMHFVIHAPFGVRINRAWGLALRKRFCRKFNFELQAAALEDSIVLSLGITHSFPAEEVAGYLKSATVRDVLVQALLAAPMFPAHWRWNANIALAVPRQRNGRRVPAQFQRNDAEDLMAVVFPDQLACFENIAGDREVPEHPLVEQTLDDCLNGVMDLPGLERMLARLERGEIRVVARDLASPSPLAQEILTARPHAFLDDAPAEERRTLAVQARRFLEPGDAAALARLDPAAIARVREEAWPEARTPDELHDALVVLGFITAAEGANNAWRFLFENLMNARRATVVNAPAGERLWVAAERLAEIQSLLPHAVCEPAIAPVSDEKTPADAESARVEILRSRLEGLGPVTQAALAAPLGLGNGDAQTALLALEQEGFVMRGRYSGGEETEWCERRLLARIHRYTLERLRREIEPVSVAQFMRFLLHWQHVGEERGRGEQALMNVFAQLEGCAVPAAAWESDILPARIEDYSPEMLDRLCLAGRVAWRRAQRGNESATKKAAPVRGTPLVIMERRHLAHWIQIVDEQRQEGSPALSSAAQRVLDVLRQHGASFFDDLAHESGLLRAQIEQALAELVARGQVTCDAFAGLRALIAPRKRRTIPGRRGYARHALPGMDEAGRWVPLAPPRASSSEAEQQRAEHVACVLLRRYGVMFRRLCEREENPPPWRELLYVYRRMEARGEIRGGRFVQGMSGEQYALPEAVAALRAARAPDGNGVFVVISAADPLNLTGVIFPGARVPAQGDNRVLYRDGAPVAAWAGGECRIMRPVENLSEWELRKRLLHRRYAVDEGHASALPVDDNT